MTRFELKRKPVEGVRLARDLEIITPMAGGGAVARILDAQQPVSGKSVRGHLRFWWRATRAGRYGKDGLRQMRRDEAWLFGTAASFAKIDEDLGPSRVQVTVETLQPGGAPGRGTPPPAYAAFPFAENRRQGVVAAPMLTGVRFRVTLTVASGRLGTGPHQDAASVTADLEAALWAWITFGGVGARTRRGFGALAVTGESSTPAELRAALGRQVLKGTAPAGVSQLDAATARTVLIGGFPDAVTAWTEGIELYKEFRQFRRPGKPHEGRSYWPEPDEVRRLTGDSAPAHAQPVTQARKFPRAVLGLPIIFHFKGDRDDLSRQGEPRDTTLRGQQSDRLASPVLIRPGAGGLLIATVLCRASHPQDPLSSLILQKSRGTDRVQHQLTVQEAADLQARVPKDDPDPTRFSEDIPAAFLKFLQETLK